MNIFIENVSNEKSLFHLVIRKHLDNLALNKQTSSNIQQDESNLEEQTKEISNQPDDSLNNIISSFDSLITSYFNSQQESSMAFDTNVTRKKKKKSKKQNQLKQTKQQEIAAASSFNITSESASQMFAEKVSFMPSASNLIQLN